jgi:hypothetical protein
MIIEGKGKIFGMGFDKKRAQIVELIRFDKENTQNK